MRRIFLTIWEPTRFWTELLLHEVWYFCHSWPVKLSTTKYFIMGEKKWIGKCEDFWETGAWTSATNLIYKECKMGAYSKTNREFLDYQYVCSLVHTSSFSARHFTRLPIIFCNQTWSSNIGLYNIPFMGVLKWNLRNFCAVIYVWTSPRVVYVCMWTALARKCSLHNLET
jgi:hypothetical protein